MAELNPKTATLREVAELYATKSKRGKTFVTSTLQYFKNIADEPGSAMRLFEKDAEGNTLLSKTFKDTEDTSTVKTAMQNLRQIGLTLKGMLGPDTPEYALMPDKAPDTDLNTRIFGRSEPAKAVSEVSINPDKKKMSQLFNGVAKYLDDSEMRPVAQAIIFNLNTGLRPNAVAGLEVSSYKPDTGAIYVTAETQGAKGRAVNIPLNPIADSILQDRLRKGAKGNFFTKANGSAVTSADMTKLLKTIKVPDIAYDANTGRYFDTLSPEGFSGKKGSALLRNVHATIGHSIGISGERLAYLQGRSLKAASKGSTGELATYQVAFPGAVGDFDREQAGKFASYWSDAASEAGFDIQSKIPMPEARITTQTSGFEGYFDLPVQDEVKEPTVDQPAAPAGAEVDDAVETAKSKGLDLKELASKMAKTTGKMVLGAVGVETARQIIEEPVAFAAETAAEAAMTALKIPAGIAGGAVAAMQPSVAGEGSDIYPEMRDSDDTVYEPMPSDDMSTRVTEPDTGFLDIDRVPEAAPVDEDQGFLSR